MQQRHAIRVIYSGGNFTNTGVNGDLAEIARYYYGNGFNFGDTNTHPQDDVQYPVSIELLDGPDAGKAIAYLFPNGFQEQATQTYQWLRNYTLQPSWASNVGGNHVILLPASEMLCLRLLQESTPARFGNPPKGCRK